MSDMLGVSGERVRKALLNVDDDEVGFDVVAKDDIRELIEFVVLVWDAKRWRGSC
jgi:hypothetical protein